MTHEKKIAELYAEAEKLASEFVEEQARKILREHPKLNEFVMAMGSWFFTLKGVSSRDLTYSTADYGDCPAYIKNSKLAKFINEWDDLLKITVEPMRFTADGPVQRNW